MGKLGNLLGSGIGLVSEAIAARKENAANATDSPPGGRKNTYNSSQATDSYPSPSPDDSPSPYAELSAEQPSLSTNSAQSVPINSHVELPTTQQPYGGSFAYNGEEASSRQVDKTPRGLDDMTNSNTSLPKESPTGKQSEKQLIDTFVARHPPPPYSGNEPYPRGRLSLPVIIPQRRPEDKKRGFAKAYAPVLQDCGIDQETFLEFLTIFHQSSKEDPWLNAVNVGGAVAGFAPSVIAMGVSIGIQVTAGVAMEVQRRTRTNTFLDRVNNEFFKPRGLYCLIMTYKPESAATNETVDLNTAISTSVQGSENRDKTFKQNMQVSSGTTYGEIELPQAAPLIYPDSDDNADDGSEKEVKKQNKLKSGMNFASDYFDRRAQAKYAAENPGSVLATPPSEKQFANKFSDPNHPANSGSIVSLLSGGAIDLKRGRRISGVTKLVSARGQGTPDDAPPRKRGERKSIIKKIVKRDVLYLMIVNLPSDEEMQEGLNAVQGITSN
ncbi:hypothetical protein V8C37DRAFT_386647 [Trichoderma ceciliae]